MPALPFHFPPRTIGGHVSLTLNGTLITLFVTFFIYDFQRDSAERMAHKQTTLEEQARIAMVSLQELNSPVELQRRMDELRWQMTASHSDEHVVAVEKENRLYQSGMNAASSETLTDAFRSTRQPGIDGLKLGGKDFIIGSHAEGDMIVYVAEDLEETRGLIRGQFLARLAFVALALMAGTIMMNIVLWLAIHRPMREMEKAVAEIGKGNLGLQVESSGAAEFDTLVTSINNMSQALGDAERDHAIQMRKALAIQNSLSPSQISVPGFQIASHFQPAAAVGGDYYDVLELTDGSRLICVADVTGHGVSAAMVAAMVKICVLSAVEQWHEPGKILEFVDRRLSGMSLPDMFVSMFLIRIFEDRAYLEFAGAGHPSAILIDQDALMRELKSDGPLLGIGADLAWETRRETFAEGDRLVMYTDGIPEAAGLKPGFFGMDRLIKFLESSRGESPSNSVKAIINRLHGYFEGQPANDDITMLIVDRISEESPTETRDSFEDLNSDFLTGAVM